MLDIPGDWMWERQWANVRIRCCPLVPTSPLQRGAPTVVPANSPWQVHRCRLRRTQPPVRASGWFLVQIRHNPLLEFAWMLSSSTWKGYLKRTCEFPFLHAKFNNLRQ